MVFFLVLEGIDGSGKSTVADGLMGWFEELGIKVLRTKEPSELVTGATISLLLKSKETLSPYTWTLLFSADRREHVDKVILPALDSGLSVLSERYFYSTYAYELALGVERELIDFLNLDFPVPDLCVVIDVPAEVAVERMGRRYVGREERKGYFEEKKEFLERVRENYLSLAEEREEVEVVDGTGRPEKVLERVKRVVEGAI